MMEYEMEKFRGLASSLFEKHVASFVIFSPCIPGLSKNTTNKVHFYGSRVRLLLKL
jgi:hypothetical protein